MKKQLLFLYLLMISLTAAAQDTIPNGNFELWDSSTYEFPQYYPLTSNPQTFFQCHTAFNVTKTTDAYHGTYGVKLVTRGTIRDTCGGFFLNASNANGNPSSWTGGIPYNQQPTGIRGFYKYNVPTADSAIIVVVFKQAGTAIGVYFFKIGGVLNLYTNFDFTFSPALSLVPDTVIFAAASSDLINTNGHVGSTLYLDSISFTGGVTQPATMNGDFEAWQSQSLFNPVDWNGSDGSGMGLSRSTDAAVGTVYSAQLVTYAGGNNTPTAQAGSITNGHWNSSCSCFIDGSPFSNQVDTLAFYYKLKASPFSTDDSASVNLTFKKNGLIVGGTGMNLVHSNSYLYTELPFDVGTVPDTVIITLQSTMSNDTALSFVGGIFRADELHFKAPHVFTGIHADNSAGNAVRFYPNPFKTFAVLEIDEKITMKETELRMYDVFGRMMRKVNVDKHKIAVEKNDLSAGLYFYELRNNSEILKTGKIMIE